MTTRTCAIVGTGAIAGAHAEAITALPGRARLVGAVDVQPDRAEAFAATWGVPTYPTLAALLDAERPDLVHLCTPPGSHLPLALECLAAGAAPVVEKPPVLSLAELDRLRAAEAAAGVPVATVFQHRFGSGAVRLRRLLAEGVLGRPLLASAHTLWFRDDDYFAVPWRGRWDVEGGGPTMGHGIHQFDLLLSILGPWTSVTAIAERQARPTDTEDVSAALVRFRSGAVATVVNSLVSPRQTSQLRFDFDHATVDLEHLYGYTNANWSLTAAPDVTAAWDSDQADIPSGHTAQLTAVLDALDAGETPPVSTTDTRMTMEFVAAVYASSFTGRTVTQGEIAEGNPFYDSMAGTGAPWLSLADGASTQA
ncbi:Gfo/Idh/MocA family oxidoreductase [Saccharothrix sp. S26]|uniref:Gfo/Idh/MocA family protein n=1 Tax=Saccharothrix sp. S26 TaxID=2907215 RepID=UPI001F313216|nr:Gfo/Idh/MocA family oxidoreductase [Saccharothrix sp. S26]MCE6996115.1 Gfo/Idh/MocA family oxidoreductase [Saccharothrix sp. S26]